MSRPYEAIVIGGGVNGLTAAVCLANAGRRTLLLEARDAIGGQARTREFAPGFRSSPLGTDAGWLPPSVARALGIDPPELAVPECPLAVPVGGGGAGGEREWLVLAGEMSRAVAGIQRYSARDAAKWVAFCTQLAKLSGFLAELYRLPAPDIEARTLREMVPLLGVARKLRGLGRRDMVELLRTVPMSVQELLDDWFECEPLKAAVGAVGVTDLRQGPRSGGTGFLLLHHQVGAAPGAIRGRGYWETGPDALIGALAAKARSRGVEMRTGAPVMRVMVREDRVTGVVLEGGEEIAAPLVLSSADPAHTFLHLVDPVWLDPEFLLAIRNIKFRGSTAVVSYALDTLPAFPGLPEPASGLAGALCLTGSLGDLERAADAAKYGRVSDRPFVTVEIPSLRWPGLAPAGKQVLVARAQWAPYRLREGEWDDGRRSALGNRVTGAIEEVSPGFTGLVRHREVLTPLDLEQQYGLTEGAVTHGEMTLDQILFMRPVAGAARYATPIKGLYLGGAGTHPGPGIAGGPGWLAARQVLADHNSRRSSG